MNESSPGPDSELLRTFVAVARHGNSTHAARTLNRTQSAVSIHIRRLEKELGVQLFERQARGMVPTEAGRSLIPSAERALKHIDAIAAQFGEPLEGKLRIGIPDDYSQVVLQRTLVQFSQRHQHVEVHVTSGCSGGYPEMVSENQLDLAIYSAPPDYRDAPFFAEPMVWVGHQDLHLELGTPLPLAIFDRHCWWRDIPTDALAESGLDWRVVVSTESHDGVRAAIISGMAIGIMPRSELPPNCAVIPNRPPLPPSSLVLLTANDATTDLTEAMAESVRNAFASL